MNAEIARLKNFKFNDEPTDSYGPKTPAERVDGQHGPKIG